MQPEAEELVSTWREKAATLRKMAAADNTTVVFIGGAVANASTYEVCARDLELLIERAGEDEHV